MVFGALVVWLVLFIAAAVAWRWPVLREIRAGERRRPDASIYGGLLRLQPGVAPIRWLPLALLLFAAPRRCSSGDSLGRRQYPIPTADVELRGSELTAA